MDYQEELLELAKREGIQGLRGEKYENVYNKVFIKLMDENEQLKKVIEFKDKCFYELHDKYIELEKENNELKNEIKSKEEILQKYYRDAKEILISNKGTEMYQNELKEENQKLRELIKLLL